MKILLVHNFYKIAGGEDAVMQNEIEMLESNGHSVQLYTVNNDTIKTFFRKIAVSLNVSFSFSQYLAMKEQLTVEKPDIVHVHNYFPLLSPSIFYACKKVNIPVVHTLHNYRSVCPTAVLMHDGKVNEKSINGNSWWTVSRKVYRNSVLASFTLAIMVELHKFLGTWQTKVDYFIALTNISKMKFIEAGWPQSKLVVKPNFIVDPFESIIKKKQDNPSPSYALYIGRLSEEKGLDILIRSWVNCTLPLKIIGDGPLRDMVMSSQNSSIEYLGRKDKYEAMKIVSEASFIVMPSVWNETFGMVIVEAFACGVPVVGSDLGGMRELIRNEYTGLHFIAGDEKDMMKKVRWMIANPDKVEQMGRNARNEYLSKYTPEKNYQMLMDIYQQAIVEGKRPHEKGK